ncbi:MAG TPA: hypothetical protein VIL65_13965 [Beijerinckiaceae bacterium]|jgi:hypothetical protein
MTSSSRSTSPLTDRLNDLLAEIEALKAERRDEEIRLARARIAAVHARKRLVRRGAAA